MNKAVPVLFPTHTLVVERPLAASAASPVGAVPKKQEAANGQAPAWAAKKVEESWSQAASWEQPGDGGGGRGW